MRQFTPLTLNKYREEVYGEPQSPRWVVCGWCGRSISHNKRDRRIWIGDDGLVYCPECYQHFRQGEKE